ncbi:hypothetical protein ACVIGB_000832 [Bradyrhizobium sp. USDA 4341]
MNTSIVRLQLPYPGWLKDSMNSIGVELPPLVDVEIPCFEEREAPVAIEVIFAHNDSWAAMLFPDEEGHDRGVLPIRKIGQRLYAQTPTLSGCEPEPFTITGAPTHLSIRPATLPQWLQVQGRSDPTFLPIPLEQYDGRTSSEAVQFLRGATPEQQIIDHAMNKTAFIGGALHIAVHEPVWELFRTPNGPAAARICVPVAESYNALTRARLDRREEVEAAFPQIVRRRAGERETMKFAGEVNFIDPDGFRLTRDDASNIALDTAQRLLAVTSDRAAWLSSSETIARAELAWCLHAGDYTAEQLFALSDEFAQRLDRAPQPNKEAMRIARISRVRRQVWTELGRAEGAA